MAPLRALGFALLLVAGAVAIAEARPFAREGLVFSDELGGFVILIQPRVGFAGDPRYSPMPLQEERDVSASAIICVLADLIGGPAPPC